MAQKNKLLADLLGQDICFLFRIFDNRIRLVGGCVRDFLLNQKAHDVDLATPLPPPKVIEILKKNQVDYYETGIKHGTVTAVIHKKSYEITSLRSDEQTNGRHATVRFGVSYEEDALRRDFSMNALYMDFSGVVYDYVGGKADIEKKYVRFIGDAKTRIQEDYLRLLRYFRFVAKLGGERFSQEALEACRFLKEGLVHISKERIRDEFCRLLLEKHAVLALELMAKYGVLDILLEKYDIESFQRFLIIYPKADAVERLCVLACFSPPADWKWSKAQKKQINACCAVYPFPAKEEKAGKYLLWRLGRKGFCFQLAKWRLLKPFSIKKYYALLSLKKPFFPVTGQDFYNQGYRGCQIKKMLQLSEKKWVKMNFPEKKVLVITEGLLYNKK